MSLEEKIARLEKEITEMEARLPKHSVPPTLVMELEELEDELAALKARRDSEPD
jgi:hypothetical protein